MPPESPKKPFLAPSQVWKSKIEKHGNPMKSRLVVISLVVAIVGMVAWGYALVTRPGTKPAQATNVVMGAAGLTGPTEGQAAPKGGAAPSERVVDQAAPATVRLGLSFAIGYFLAWGIKVFAKVTLLIFGALGVGLVALTHYHVFGLDWSIVQDKLESSLAFLQGEAKQFKNFVMGYLPSAGSAVAGTVFGFRHRA